jgi:hypothetical protein
MSLLSFVKQKAEALVQTLGDDAFKVALADEGTGPVYNTVTIQDADFLVGQMWSGPPDDPENPQDGPVPANVNNAVMAMLVTSIINGLNARATVIRNTAQLVSGTATITHTSATVDSDLFTLSSGVVELDNPSGAAGAYEVTVTAIAEYTSLDNVMIFWIAKNGAEETGTRGAAQITSVLTRQSMAISSTLYGLVNGDTIEIKAQGTGNITKMVFEVKRVL